MNIKMRMKEFSKALLRKKKINCETESKLDRCLSTADLTFLGIGSTLGLGIYVIAGQVAATTAGPAVILSFLIAAIASVFAGLCYAEFGARVPRAGSAYVYSYVTVGEFVAFIIGWNLILEYVIGTASVARGYSGYIDSLFNSAIKNYFNATLPIRVDHMSDYPDFLALGITLLLTVILCVGVKESTKFNNLFTGLNLLIVLYVIICGCFKADIKNWQLKEDEVPKNAGKGGFFPYGVSMMMTGASTCFYAFVGFDCVATSGEEVRNPQRAIPISIVVSLTVVFLSYFGVSAIQTLMWPYYDQHGDAPLPEVFKLVGWDSAKWVISIGALAGLSTSLLGAMFPLPRVLYAMASDGVIFRFVANIHPKFKTPLIATIFSGIFSGVMAMMFNVDDLAQMMSIGTLLAYSLVAISVLILRYKINFEMVPMHPPLQASPNTPISDNEVYQTIPDLMSTSVQMSNSVMFSLQQYTKKEIQRQIFNLDKHLLPTQLSSKLSTWLIIIIGILCMIFDILLVALEDYLTEIGTIIALAITGLTLITSIVSLWRQPQSPTNISFKAPFLPLIPVLSVFCNIYLMLKLHYMTWIRFAGWMAAGFLIYFSYGIRNSNERLQRDRSISQAPLFGNDNCTDSEDQAGPPSTEVSPLVKHH